MASPSSPSSPHASSDFLTSSDSQFTTLTPTASTSTSDPSSNPSSTSTTSTSPSPNPPDLTSELNALFSTAEPWYTTYAARQVISVSGGLVAGAVLGLNHGVTTAGLRFRAENAHRLPATTKGWYLYHKSKNYYAMWGGVREAARMSAKVGFWAGAFVAAEESVARLRRHAAERVCDQVRDQQAYLRWQRSGGVGGREGGRGGGGGREGKGLGEETVAPALATPPAADALNTVVAGLAVAGGWSAWNRFPLITAARTARMGLVFGLVYGLVQDATRLLGGRKVTYVEFAKRKLAGREQGVETEAVEG